MAELEKMTDAQINEKLQAMLVSCGIFSNILYYIMMMHYITCVHDRAA